MKDHFPKNAPISFLFPIDGDCLNSRDGHEEDGRLTVTVRVAAPAGHCVEINGCRAVWRAGAYEAAVRAMRAAGYRGRFLSDAVRED